MLRAPEMLLLVFILPLFIFIAFCLHEYSHWCIARIWTDEIDIIRWKHIVPRSINFTAPQDMPAYGIRLTAMAPPILNLPIFVGILLLGDASFMISFFVGIPFLAAASLSRSDLFAILEPNQFQELSADNAQISFSQAVSIHQAN